jgi:SSS family solute:Na+ symporter
MRALFVLACGAAAVSPPPLHAYHGSTPTLDGLLTPGEWSDATAFGGIGSFDSQFAPVTDPSDLDVSGFVKHDGKRLYFAFNITDDVLYFFETPNWMPRQNPNADDLTVEGFPWFGDEMELLINAPNTWSNASNAVTGTPGVWQMVCNLHKSRLGGLGVGGLMEGEPRSSPTAWENYGQWIYSRAMECAVQRFPGAGAKNSSVYGMEWAIDFNPLLQTAPGVWWNASQGAVSMGLNVALGDTDTQEEEDPAGYGLRHEDWFSGNTSCTGGGNCHTLLSFLGTLVMEPGQKP